MSFEDAVKSMWNIDSKDLDNYVEVLKKVIKARKEEWLECEKEESHLKAIQDYRLLFGNK